MKLPKFSIKKIWEKSGFYVVMALCAVTVGVTALLTQQQPAPLPTVPPATTEPEAQGVAGLKGETLAPSATPKPSATQAAALPPTLNWPMQGEVLQGFEDESPVYNETLGHYAVHPAIDIAGYDGQSVHACMDGTVIALMDDLVHGSTIVVKHLDGYESTYGSLGTLALVKEGDPVKAGQTISYAGTSLAEAHLGTHLHFAFSKDGVALDPVQYLP